MATLSTTLTMIDRIERFERSEIYKQAYDHPVIRALMFTLCAINWEGNTELLHDLFEDSHDDRETYQRALGKLGYSTHATTLDNTVDIQAFTIEQPALLFYKQQYYLLLKINQGYARLYDYHNDLDIEKDLSSEKFQIISVTDFSKTFRDAAGLGNAKPQWVKSVISPYRGTLKRLFLISLAINLLSSLNPFFIMSVYNFALSANSMSTLYWIIIGGIIVVGIENFFKQERNAIFQENGEAISNHISKTVISKLVWMPYPKVCTANEESQIARLRDIDQLRKIFTAESTQNYLDLPFFIIFLVALVMLAGSTAVIIIGGLILYIIYGIVSKVNYSLAATQSSQAQAKVQGQWHDTLSNLESIQGLPLQKISTMRFSSAYAQAGSDSTIMGTLNQKIMRDGQSISQVIGTSCIVYASYIVMEGDLDFGAMLAIIMLIWKCLAPFMEIYNSINKMTQVKKSAQQVDALMMLDDDRKDMSNSTPIIDAKGQLEFKEVGYRYMVSGFTLKQISFKIMPGELFVLSGLSGSGKSTLLDIFAKLIENYQGQVFIDGMNIKQFNGFMYREVLRYKSANLEFFDTSFSENFYLYNGYHDQAYLEHAIQYFSLQAYLPDGIQTHLSHQLGSSLPSSIKELIDILLCIGSKDTGFIVIDNLFNDADDSLIRRFIRFLEDHFQESTRILVSNHPTILANASNVLLMDLDGSQKFCGSPEKVLDQYDNLLNAKL